LEYLFFDKRVNYNLKKKSTSYFPVSAVDVDTSPEDASLVSDVEAIALVKKVDKEHKAEVREVNTYDLLKIYGNKYQSNSFITPPN
jgi:hypothetical protein